MYCPYCGNPCTDNARFCPACGAAIDPDQPMPDPNNATGDFNQPPQPPATPPGKSHAPILIVLISVAILLVVGGGIALSSHVPNQPDATNDATSDDVDTKTHDSGKVDTHAASNLSIAVQQIDASSFPRVKVYLEVEDPTTGDVPQDLDASFFYLKRADANASYVKQEVLSVNRLDNKEALNVDLVADVSGSMRGQPLDDAQTVMRNFIDSMQFDTGDTAELISFSTGVRLECAFTDDADLLKHGVNSLTATNQTSLYDALYTAVERVAAQGGARCVIAFTDGLDNTSSVTIDEVKEIALRYRIPIFIVGVGDSDYASVSELAETTGGTYFNVADTISMQSIYEQIYRIEKDLYLLEYNDNSGATMTDTADIQVGYSNDDYQGACDYSYTPHILNSVQGKQLYSTGPEATVEGYLRNWAPSITNADYSLIAPYIKDGSNIHAMQEEFVQNRIAERIDSYEITDTAYSDDAHCVISTREMFYVQQDDEPLKLITQTVKYSVELVNGTWLMTDLFDLEASDIIK